MRHTPNTDDVQRMIARALTADRARLHARLLSAAKGLGGSARAAVEAVAGVLADEEQPRMEGVRP